MLCTASALFVHVWAGDKLKIIMALTKHYVIVKSAVSVGLIGMHKTG